MSAIGWRARPSCESRSRRRSWPAPRPSRRCGRRTSSCRRCRTRCATPLNAVLGWTRILHRPGRRRPELLCSGRCSVIDRNATAQATDDRRYARYGADRGRQAAAGDAAGRSRWRRAGRGGRHHAVGEGQADRGPDAVSIRRRRGSLGDPRSAPAGRLEPAVERGEVHRAGGRDRGAASSPSGEA